MAEYINFLYYTVVNNGSVTSGKIDCDRLVEFMAKDGIWIEWLLS
jgi:hypothetical protein